MQYKSICMPHCVYDSEKANEVIVGAPDMLAIALVSSGRCMLQGNSVCGLHAGELAAARGTLHFVDAKNCHIVAVALQGVAAAQLCAELHDPRILDGTTSCPEAAEILYRLLAGQSVQLPEAETSALAYALVCQVAQAQTNKRKSHLVAAAIAEIHRHYADVYGVEELAAQMGISKSHLVRCFSAEMGVSPGRFLNTVRLDAAKKLLLQSDFSLEIIAGLCGFSCANYFCKVFKKYTGCTPIHWRDSSLPMQHSLGAHAGGDVELDESLYV